MTDRLEKWLKILADEVNGPEGKKLWDVLTCLRGPDSPSEMGSAMSGSANAAAYDARRERKYRTVEIIRGRAGLHGGSARFHADTRVVLPPPARWDHFDKHVAKAADALGLTITIDENAPSGVAWATAPAPASLPPKSVRVTPIGMGQLGQQTEKKAKSAAQSMIDAAKNPKKVYAHASFAYDPKSVSGGMAIDWAGAQAQVEAAPTPTAEEATTTPGPKTFMTPIAPSANLSLGFDDHSNLPVTANALSIVIYPEQLEKLVKITYKELNGTFRTIPVAGKALAKHAAAGKPTPTKMSVRMVLDRSAYVTTLVRHLCQTAFGLNGSLIHLAHFKSTQPQTHRVYRALRFNELLANEMGRVSSQLSLSAVTPDDWTTIPGAVTLGGLSMMELIDITDAVGATPFAFGVSLPSLAMVILRDACRIWRTPDIGWSMALFKGIGEALIESSGVIDHALVTNKPAILVSGTPTLTTSGKMLFSEIHNAAWKILSQPASPSSATLPEKITAAYRQATVQAMTAASPEVTPDDIPF